MGVLETGVTLLLLLSFAAAEPLSENPVFEIALASYRDLEFERALAILDDLDGNAARFADKDRALLQLWRGIVQTQLGERDAADAAIESALDLAPSIVVPADAPPAFVHRVQTLQAARLEKVVETPTPDPPDGIAPDPAPVVEVNANGTIGLSLLVGGGAVALASAVALVVVDGALGTPADFGERQTLSGVAGVSAVLAGVGVIAAGAGAGLLWLE